MQVIIIGAGEVGQSIAADLAHTHEVTVIEQNSDLVNEITYSLDVLSVEGDGTNIATLRKAEIEAADLLIACTDSDEANIIACGIAKAIGEIFTICRVKRQSLLTTWQAAKGAFGVDFLVSTDLLTAEAIFRVSGLPGSHDVNTFVEGIVQMAEFDVGEQSPIANQTIQEADQYESLTFAALFRSGEVIIPEGSTPIKAHDRIVVIGSPSAVQEFAIDTTTGDINLDNIVIVGGSDIGFQTATVFQDHGYRPRLIEQDHQRARELAEELSSTTVLESDATDIGFLHRERVEDADLVISTFNNDDLNLLVSVMADAIGAKRTIAVVESGNYVDIFERVGVDVAISPLEEVAEKVVQFTRDDHTEKVAMLEHDQAEVFEIEVKENSTLVDRSIIDAMNDFPDNVVIGAISRTDDLVTPRGQTVIKPRDHLVVFAETSVVEEVSHLI